MTRDRFAHSTLSLHLGELELSVLNILWSQPDSDARSITDILSSERDIKLSTVQTTLERLVRKGLLTRNKVSYAYYYSPARSRGQVLGDLMKDVVQLLHDGQANTILTSFVNVAATIDDAALDQLEILIRNKRRQLQEDSDD